MNCCQFARTCDFILKWRQGNVLKCVELHVWTRWSATVPFVI